MYISLDWLKEFVKVPAKIGADAIAGELTGHTVEVEGFVSQASQFNNVVVGKVLEVGKHPNADRLHLAVVDIKKKKLRIVCGAPNIAAGQLVPVAMAGAILPGGFEIQVSEIRGERSEGMICAEDELGIGKNHDGIMVLNSEAKIGEPFAKYLQADDTILEIDNKSLSNRPDLLSHYGISRELGVIFDLAVKPYDKFFNRKFSFSEAKEDKLEVKIEDKEACPRYMAVKIDGLEIKESPAWLKKRLVAVSQKPINNIVDLTNYIMLECGQPLHAFDAGKVGKIVVRRGRKNEVFETLDEKERNLSEEDLVISDGQEAIAIAGIMGGKASGVSLETKSIILEAANFNAGSVRKTSQRLGLRTEASTRFEKSLDANLTEEALFRFLTLLADICPQMHIASPLIDVRSAVQEPEPVELSLDWLAKKIGQEIPKEQVVKSLEKLGFKLEDKDNGIFSVSIPSWRATKDVSAREDLAEEVLRIYGYDRIVSKLPIETWSLPEVNGERKLERKIKDILVLENSLTEVYNYSFVGEDQLKKLNIDFFNHLKLANPLSDNHTMLRQSLIPGLAGNVKNNHYKAERLGFFEFGNVFFPVSGSIKKESAGDETLPCQEKRLALALADEQENLFGRLKGIIDGLMRDLFGFEMETGFLPAENIPGWADKKTAAKIMIFDKEIGLAALLSPEADGNINLKRPAAFAEIDFNILAGLFLSTPTRCFREPAKYPAVIRDLAFVLDEKILYNEFKAEILGFDPLIKAVELFDIYTGSKLAGGEKSLAFHITFQSEDRTLLAAEVDKAVNDLIRHLGEKFEARLRD